MKEIIERFKEFNNGELYHLMKHSDHGHKEYRNPYHMEGSVWTHTEMVLEEAFKIDPENKMLIYAALLHDIGKIFTREVVFKKEPMHIIDLLDEFEEEIDSFLDDSTY